MSACALILKDATRGGVIEKINRLIERLYDNRSRIVITSGELEPVLGGGGYSAFARALINALTENSKSAFTSADVYSELQSLVSSVAVQTPTRNPFSLVDSGGDFVFVRRGNP